MAEYPTDIIVASRKIAQLFIQRCAEFEVSPEAICKACGVTPGQYDAWTQSLDPDNAIRKISQAEVIALLAAVHVDIQLTHVVTRKDALTADQVESVRNLQRQYAQR